MVLQPDSELFSEDKPSGKTSSLPGGLLWDRLIDQVPLGMFIVSGRGEKVKFNEQLGQLLNLESTAKIDQRVFW
jgi:hypothetical protein